GQGSRNRRPSTAQPLIRPTGLAPGTAPGLRRQSSAPSPPRHAPTARPPWRAGRSRCGRRTARTTPIDLGPLPAEATDDALPQERPERADQAGAVGRAALLMLPLDGPVEPADPGLVVADRLAELLSGEGDHQLGLRPDALHH